MITQAQIRQLYSYSPDSGAFVFLPRPEQMFKTYRAWSIFQKKSLGKVAGWRNALGYWTINVDGKPQLAHRMAWLWMTGEMPADEVDHINGDRSDNRFANLRSVTKVENCHNQSLHHANKTGVSGVMWDKRRGAWRAEIKSNDRVIYLGQFKTIEEAAAARKGAMKALGWHSGHGKQRVADYRYTPKKPRNHLLAPAVNPSPEAQADDGTGNGYGSNQH